MSRAGKAGNSLMLGRRQKSGRPRVDFFEYQTPLLRSRVAVADSSISRYFAIPRLRVARHDWHEGQI